MEWRINYLFRLKDNYQELYIIDKFAKRNQCNRGGCGVLLRLRKTFQNVLALRRGKPNPNWWGVSFLISAHTHLILLMILLRQKNAEAARSLHRGERNGSDKSPTGPPLQQRRWWWSCRRTSGWRTFCLIFTSVVFASSFEFLIFRCGRYAGGRRIFLLFFIGGDSSAADQLPERHLDVCERLGHTLADGVLRVHHELGADRRQVHGSPNLLSFFFF